MEVDISKSYEELSRKAANVIADVLNAKPNAVLGMATGSSPLGLYQELVRMHRDEGLNFSQVTTFNLDEYVGLPVTHNQSYHYFTHENFFKHVTLYSADLPIKDKIERIAEKIYGADGVEYYPEAEAKIKLYTELGFDKLPICMAKTHLSLSHDEKLQGRPRRFKIPVRDMRAFTGAGFLTPICGTIQTMPALPRVPAGTHIDVDELGRITGLG